MTSTTSSFTPNPNDSMKQTWPTWDKSRWQVYHTVIDSLDVYPIGDGKHVPVHPKTDKVPHLPQWSQHAWILSFAWIPLAIHQLFLQVTGASYLHSVAVFLLYTTALNLTVVHEVKVLKKLGGIHGFLDGDQHARDGIPDVGVVRIFYSLLKTIGGRLALFVYLAYDKTVSPAEALSKPSWWTTTVVQIGLYAVVLDFWFYVYHRAMHDIGPLWRFHRKHHLTKHPNPLLSAYADDEQEVFDMFIVPLLTFFSMSALGFKLGFYEWWVCQQYIVYTEVWGHSGLRVHLVAPSTFAPILTLIGCELAVEDHDLHHRKGYRKSYNYGKQTRVWDRLFGTCHPRIESQADNIDWVNQARMPLW